MLPNKKMLTFYAALQDNVTTTTILENFPEVSCPRGFPVVVRIVCTSLATQIRPTGVFLAFVFRITFGYVQPGGGYVPVLHFALTGRVGIQSSIDCPRRIIVVTVATLRLFNIVGSCETGSCTIDHAVAERVFPMRTWCGNILSVNLKENFYILLPTHISCDSCSTGVYRQGCAYISCSPVIVW
ncbi:uncharacterized protein [Erythrolamprus reginae]|uniref:uncharacterized protein isoform X2 n=1 Tax=Erythrolamprus reginae TaxID=121349 RepID=UPI00396C55E0